MRRLCVVALLAASMFALGAASAQIIAGPDPKSAKQLSANAAAKIKRVERAWEAGGGDPIALAEQLEQCRDTYELAEITMGGEPDPIDLVVNVKPAPFAPAEFNNVPTPPVCRVVFNVDTNGEPYDIKPRCEDFELADLAGGYIADLKFRGQVVRGVPARRIDLVYPVTFRSAAD